MALNIVANRPDPAIVALPWSTPLEDWTEHVVPFPRGLSRHVVRIVRLGDRVYAVKETTEAIAMREYRMLRDLHRLGLPVVTPQGVVSGRVDREGDPLPAVLLTQHLRFSLPYRSLFSHGITRDNIPSLVDAVVVLLVRLHLAGFYWGDVSLSNLLFRRSAGDFAAYLVDAETGELHDTVSDRMRAYDLTVGCENIFAELLDLQASGALDTGDRAGTLDGREITDRLQEQYAALWRHLTDAEEFGTDEMWRIEERIESLNDLGFDVDELSIVTDLGRNVVSIQPKVVELGHHRRELQALTGLDVEDNQARQLLNDLAAFTAAHGYGDEERHLVANRWLTQVYEPIMAMVPPPLRGKREPAEIFHEILVHRWGLSEEAGQEVDIFDAARDYIATVLTTRPDEQLAAEDL
ncbi:MAG TPA: DUF4032 domain-containing protein [Marmoricola sp.]